MPKPDSYAQVAGVHIVAACAGLVRCSEASRADKPKHDRGAVRLLSPIHALLACHQPTQPPAVRLPCNQ